MWYSFPFTPSLGLHITVFRVPLHFEPSNHPFLPISTQNIHPCFIEVSFLSTSDFIPVVWFTPKPCGTHFLLPHHLVHIAVFRVPLHFEPSDHPFPPISPKKFTSFHTRVPPQQVGLHPRRLVHPKAAWYSFPFTPSLGLHITVFRVSLHFEPSDHPFPPFSPQNIYPHSIDRFLLSTSDSIPFVWFTPKPCGNHLLLPHHLTHILQSFESPSTLNPPTIHFPRFQS